MERIQEIQQRWREDGGGGQPITPDQQMDQDVGDDAYDTGSSIFPAEWNV